MRARNRLVIVFHLEVFLDFPIFNPNIIICPQLFLMHIQTSRVRHCINTVEHNLVCTLLLTLGDWCSNLILNSIPLICLLIRAFIAINILGSTAIPYHSNATQFFQLR